VTTQSDAIPESPRDSQINDSQINRSRTIAPPASSWTQPMYWSIRRELWEYRSIYIAPLAAAALFLFGYLISMIHLPARMRAALTPMQQHQLIEQPYLYAAGMIMVTTLIVAVFYSLDALHGERRDRGILFWKSLPVSDLTTVLSKASIPLVVLPLLTFAITVLTQWIMLLLSTAVLLGSGLGVPTLWTHASFVQMSLMLLYHLLAIHSLWYAPFYGWLLLVSGWARRAPFLWALLPALTIGVVEKIAFNTTRFANLLGARLGDAPGADAMFGPGGVMTHPLTPGILGEFFSSPGLWTGLAITAAFLAIAVRLRRYQGPI